MPSVVRRVKFFSLPRERVDVGPCRTLPRVVANRPNSESSSPPAVRRLPSAVSLSLPRLTPARRRATDKSIRDDAVKAVTRYLRQAHSLTELELSKVWKALFYCMWHSDKRPVQADLAERLSALVHALPAEKRPLFTRVFWRTMAREWHGIDRLRLDKFYMLMRLALRHSLRALCADALDEQSATAFAALLQDGLFASGAPRGVQLFGLDQYLTALRGELPADAAPAVWMALLDPPLLLLGAVADPHVLQRGTEQLLNPLIEAGAEGEAGEEGEAGAGNGEGGEGAPLPRLLCELSERLFDLAADPRTAEANRQALYGLQRRAEQRTEQSGASAARLAEEDAPRPRQGAGKAVGRGEKSRALRGMMSGDARKASGGLKRRSAPAPSNKPRKQKSRHVA